jgi:hypothetical protein
MSSLLRRKDDNVLPLRSRGRDRPTTPLRHQPGVGDFEVATGGGIWVAVRVSRELDHGATVRTRSHLARAQSFQRNRQLSATPRARNRGLKVTHDRCMPGSITRIFAVAAEHCLKLWNARHGRRTRPLGDTRAFRQAPPLVRQPPQRPSCLAVAYALNVQNDRSGVGQSARKRSKRTQLVPISPAPVAPV